jgi:hypothetical protein
MKDRAKRRIRQFRDGRGEAFVSTISTTLIFPKSD